ncbi:MAG TPA: hypothetical protein VHV32_18600 [Candidatus Angelobacter sp.]|nr:hypothetical protein [Candidatus Angelobacter sp.]
MPARTSHAYLGVAIVVLLVFAACRQNSTASANTTATPESPVADSPIRITSPVDGATVPERPFVDVSVSGPAGSFWIIIHPTEVSN